MRTYFLHKSRFFWLILLLMSASLQAEQNIILWHSLENPLVDRFLEIIHRFNQKPECINAGIKIIPKFKGNYEQTLQAGLKAAGTAEAPQILQVYDVGSLAMQAHSNAYVPLDRLSEVESNFLQSEHFLPAISAFYKDRHGRKALPCLPFSTYSVVLFYNKSAFREAGLDPERPPETWEEFERIAPILRKARPENYVMAATWLSGHHIEQLGAWHNESIATKGNGVDGDGAVLQLNRPFFIHHLEKLVNWHWKGFFSLEAGIKADEAFAKGKVVMLTDSANHWTILNELVQGNFEIGVASFPFWQSKVSKNYNIAIAGTSFWALAGHDPKDYPVIQRFFEYLVSPEIQAEWHEKTCYMPVIKDAQKLVEAHGFYQKDLKGKVARIAMNSFMGPPQEYSRGILLPQYSKIRAIIVQEMKEAIKGNKTPIEALNQVVNLGNSLILEGATP